MAISNYSKLKTAVQTWNAHDDISDVIDDLIDMAEAVFNRTISVQDSVTVASSTVPAGGEITLPTDYLEMVAFYVTAGTGNTTMRYLPPKKFFGAIGQIAQGSPKYYTIAGSTLYVMPSPDSGTGYTYYLVYKAKLTGLSSTSTTNWLLTKAPDIYLQGVLAEAERFLHNEEKAAMHDARVNTLIAQLQGADLRGKLRPQADAYPSGVSAGDSTWRRDW